MSNRVVHFEIPCDDPEKTMKFFREVFGWNFQQFGTEDYWMTMTGDENKPGVNGGLMKRKHPGQPVVNSIDVPDLEVSLKKIGAGGGTVVVPKMPIPGVGWLAYFKDPDGNIHGVYQNDPAAK
jgi:uncharacterized protein